MTRAEQERAAQRGILRRVSYPNLLAVHLCSGPQLPPGPASVFPNRQVSISALQFRLPSKASLAIETAGRGVEILKCGNGGVTGARLEPIRSSRSCGICPTPVMCWDRRLSGHGSRVGNPARHLQCSKGCPGNLSKGTALGHTNPDCNDSCADRPPVVVDGELLVRFYEGIDYRSYKAPSATLLGA